MLELVAAFDRLTEAKASHEAATLAVSVATVTEQGVRHYLSLTFHCFFTAFP